MPDLEPLRCAGCEMTGGFTCRTDEEAADATAAFGPLLARLRRVKFEPGDHVMESPCLPKAQLAAPESYWQKAGRPCPRVDLPPETAGAAHLAVMLYHGSASAQAFLLTRRPRARRRMYDRATAALGSPAVRAFAEAERRARELARER